MKYILTFSIIAFLNVFVSAQKENTAFLEKKMISWLDTEINTFSEAIAKAENAHGLKDNAVLGNSKSRLVRGLKRFSTNCDLIYNQIAADRVQLAENDQENDFIMGMVRYKRKKSQARLQEIYVDADTEKQIFKDVSKIGFAFGNIQKHDLEFHPTQKNTVTNIEEAKDVLAAAQNISQLLHKGIISE